MIKSLKDLLDKFSRFTNSLVYDGGICKRLNNYKKEKIYEAFVNNQELREPLIINYQEHFSNLSRNFS
jgi:hypothetical protein